MTRRLTRFIRLSGLPLTGPAHQLTRMDLFCATSQLCRRHASIHHTQQRVQ